MSTIKTLREFMQGEISHRPTYKLDKKTPIQKEYQKKVISLPT